MGVVLVLVLCLFHSISILFKHSCWFSKVKQSMSSLSLLSACGGLLAFNISFLKECSADFRVALICLFSLVIMCPVISLVFCSFCPCDQIIHAKIYFHVSPVLCLLATVLCVILWEENKSFSINIFTCLWLSFY